MNSTRSRWLFVAVASLVLAAALAACGGGSSSSSSSDTSSSAASTGGEETSAGSEIKAEAAALVAKAEQPPAEVPEAEPLKNTKIPSGKTVAFMGCGAAQCEEYFPPIKEGAEALGWSAKMYQGSVEPNKIVKFLEEIVNSKPDVFIACCISPSIAQPYFHEMKENGTILVMCCTAEKGTEDLTKLLSTPEDKFIAGENVANWMLAQEGEELNALYVNTKDFEVSAQYFEGFEKQVKKLCPECPIDEIDVGVEEIGKPSLSTTVVSYLRAHPDVNYIGTLFGPLLIGVPAAMEAAGVDVPLAATASGEIALEAVPTGKEGWMAVQNFGIEFGLQALNVAVRTMQNEPLSEETLTPEVLVTAKNASKVLSKSGNAPVIADALPQYEELWGLK
jgi:ribose transport system substrate-binding protein